MTELRARYANQMCVQATKLADDGNGECAELIATVRALVEAVVIEPEVQGRLAQLTDARVPDLGYLFTPMTR